MYTAAKSPPRSSAPNVFGTSTGEIMIAGEKTRGEEATSDSDCPIDIKFTDVTMRKPGQQVLCYIRMEDNCIIRLIESEYPFGRSGEMARR